MTIEFLFGRREALTGRSEAYKRSVRTYLESLGFSQSTDSITEGTFSDMRFHNPVIESGREFVIEAKAEKLSMHSKKFAEELVGYFRLWQSKTPSKRFKFILFCQAVRKPTQWEEIFGEINNPNEIKKWIEWYNKSHEAKSKLDSKDIEDLTGFFSESSIKVGNNVQLDLAALDKKSTSITSIERIAKSLLKVVNKRKEPIMKRSKIIMNIFPINVPEYYYVTKSTAQSLDEISTSFKGESVPPFFWTNDKTMMSFAKFDESNYLTTFAKGRMQKFPTKQLQKENPTLASRLVNIHLDKILKNKGLYKDKKLYYFPMLDDSLLKREVFDHRGKAKIVVKKVIHLKDTKYAKKGDVNFYFHRAIELKTPTYWGTSYIELIPRRYYTFDGRSPIDGEIRKKIDSKYIKLKYDRSTTRIGLMKFWRFLLTSEVSTTPQEQWFDSFDFGEFLNSPVDWSPKVIGRNQTPLWDYFGEK